MIFLLTTTLGITEQSVRRKLSAEAEFEELLGESSAERMAKAPTEIHPSEMIYLGLQLEQDQYAIPHLLLMIVNH